jgi:hypothetical protein
MALQLWQLVGRVKKPIAPGRLSHWARWPAIGGAAAARFNTGNPLGGVAVLATGFTYKLGKNLQFDAGVRFGVTEAADRFSPFFGVSARH